MKAGKPADRIPGAHIDVQAMSKARSAEQSIWMIQMGIEAKDCHGNGFPRPSPCPRRLRIQRDYEAIPFEGKIRIWVEFEHALEYPNMERPDLHIFAIKLRPNHIYQVYDKGEPSRLSLWRKVSEPTSGVQDKWWTG
ncbi:hypothetical protein MMC27_006699 [Xylographa pallens]|nr:hypothetical protein [Xylographa pallens]